MYVALKLSTSTPSFAHAASQISFNKESTIWHELQLLTSGTLIFNLISTSVLP